mmetsp:Transcript_19306/g.38971  ORF Transcript_19306/g.38971 Transcript_19306/m.38971 type:complete len:109 (-) Transcript_19306:73-399(-)
MKDIMTSSSEQVPWYGSIQVVITDHYLDDDEGDSRHPQDDDFLSPGQHHLTSKSNQRTCKRIDGATLRKRAVIAAAALAFLLVVSVLYLISSSPRTRHVIGRPFKFLV